MRKLKKMKKISLSKFVTGGFMLFCMCLLFSGSNVYAKRANPAKSKTGLKKIEGHEWTRVRIGSKWYNVDATWDDNDSVNIYIISIM